MEIWDHRGRRFALNSLYQLPEDSWSYDLTEYSQQSDHTVGLAITIPDATPDGPFTPQDETLAVTWLHTGNLPWPIVRRFAEFLDATGDLVATNTALQVTGDLNLSANTWRYGDQTFEVNSFHFGDRATWCYEIYETSNPTEDNNYIDIQIPDMNPDSGPFKPGPSHSVALNIHGEWSMPWPVFRHFLNTV
ncbi:MAG TPA: hypothetical protein DGG94_04120 [Micromonosporaceae bacterium]|nr:hypothetical protein [Micromonosporaceae bacterium]HCU48985.1 hypothetical protein [Micromonosporaceae bacterium]